MNVGFTTTTWQDLRQRYTADVHGSVFSTIVSAHQSVGNIVFTRGPAGANTRSPNVVLVRGVTQSQAW